MHRELEVNLDATRRRSMRWSSWRGFMLGNSMIAIVNISRSPDTPALLRVKAACAILDRAFGKPKFEMEDDQDEREVTSGQLVTETLSEEQRGALNSTLQTLGLRSQASEGSPAELAESDARGEAARRSGSPKLATSRRYAGEERAFGSRGDRLPPVASWRRHRGATAISDFQAPAEPSDRTKLSTWPTKDYSSSESNSARKPQGENGTHVRDVVALVRAGSRDSIVELVKLRDNFDCSAAVRLAAANAILNLAVRKPK